MDNAMSNLLMCMGMWTPNTMQWKSSRKSSVEEMYILRPLKNQIENPPSVWWPSVSSIWMTQQYWSYIYCLDWNIYIAGLPQNFLLKTGLIPPGSVPDKFENFPVSPWILGNWPTISMGMLSKTNKFFQFYSGLIPVILIPALASNSGKTRP